MVSPEEWEVWQQDGSGNRIGLATGGSGNRMGLATGGSGNSRVLATVGLQTGLNFCHAGLSETN
jgi:hypothetical protein